MNAPTRLGIYGLGLVAVFAVAALTANAVVPEETVRNWVADAEQDDHHGEATDTSGHAGHEEATATTDLGLALERDGYRLTGLTAPSAPKRSGVLSFAITDAHGAAVTAFDPQHEKELHLIVVRADGQHFSHVHPERAADGTWSIPWTWPTGGTYRVYADTAPAGADPITLSSTVQVTGPYRPVTSEPTRTASADGFTVTIDGDLAAGTSSRLTLTITRDGAPVTTLQPYLGAFGHLVALREGDLAYLHVHPHADDPEPGSTSGPEIVFESSAPTPGRYLLYLDFQVDGAVHSVPLVLDTHGEGDHDH